MLVAVLELGLGSWAAGLAAATLAQRRLIFRPPTRVRALSAGPHVGRYRVEPLTQHTCQGAVLQGWRSTPLAGPTLGTVLYFGGRGENVAWVPHMATYLDGWSVLSFNYRGFAGSTGRAGEVAVLEDARRIFDAWVPPHAPRVLMGRSLGTAVAIRLASETAPEQLILVSPFLSLAHLARANPITAPVASLLWHRLDSTRYAPRVNCRTLVVTARGDRRVPESHSRRLAHRLGGPVTLVSVDGQHHHTLPRCEAAQRHIERFVLQRSQRPPGAGQA